MKLVYENLSRVVPGTLERERKQRKVVVSGILTNVISVPFPLLWKDQVIRESEWS